MKTAITTAGFIAMLIGIAMLSVPASLITGGGVVVLASIIGELRVRNTAKTDRQ